MIDNKMKELVTLAEKTELNAWLNLDNNTPKADIITDLLITVRDSLQGARSATFNKLASLDKDETTSVRSKASRKTNRSNTSCNTSTSSGGSRSSKQTLITVKARRASLEQKIKFSDAIEEKQKALNKLKLQQRLRETLAEEAVYEKALKDEGHLFELEPELPYETEKMIDRFMTQSELSTRPLSPTAGLWSAVNVDTGIPAAPKSGTGLPAAPYPDTGLPFAQTKAQEFQLPTTLAQDSPLPPILTQDYHSPQTLAQVSQLTTTLTQNFQLSPCLSQLPCLPTQEYQLHPTLTQATQQLLSFPPFLLVQEILTLHNCLCHTQQTALLLQGSPQKEALQSPHLSWPVAQLNRSLLFLKSPYTPV